MIGAPTLGIGNVHMVAQHVPYHARLLPRRQRLRRGKSRERVKMLILDQAPAIPMTEHLIHQFPEFPFSHVSQSNPARRRECRHTNRRHTPEHDETARRASSPCGRFLSCTRYDDMHMHAASGAANRYSPIESR